MSETYRTNRGCSVRIPSGQLIGDSNEHNIAFHQRWWDVQGYFKIATIREDVFDRECVLFELCMRFPNFVDWEVRRKLEGQPVEYTCASRKRLCADLIVGFDVLGDNSRCAKMLLDELGIVKDHCSPRLACISVRLTSRLPEVPRDDKILARMHENVNEPQRNEHCRWPPVRLRWKEGVQERPKPNIRRARGEAYALEKRLSRKHPEMLIAYKDVLNTWINNRWLEKVEESSPFRS